MVAKGKSSAGRRKGSASAGASKRKPSAAKSGNKAATKKSASGTTKKATKAHRQPFGRMHATALYGQGLHYLPLFGNKWVPLDELVAAFRGLYEGLTKSAQKQRLGQIVRFILQTKGLTTAEINELASYAIYFAVQLGDDVAFELLNAEDGALLDLVHSYPYMRLMTLLYFIVTRGIDAKDDGTAAAHLAALKRLEPRTETFELIVNGASALDNVQRESPLLATLIAAAGVSTPDYIMILHEKTGPLKWKLEDDAFVEWIAGPLTHAFGDKHLHSERKKLLAGLSALFADLNAKELDTLLSEGVRWMLAPNDVYTFHYVNTYAAIFKAYHDAREQLKRPPDQAGVTQLVTTYIKRSPRLTPKSKNVLYKLYEQQAL